MSIDESRTPGPRLVLPAPRERVIVAFGEDERVASSARVQSSRNSLSTTEFVVDTKHRPGVELTTPVRIFSDNIPTGPSAKEPENPLRQPQFYGHVLEAVPVDGALRVNAESGRELKEKPIGILLTRKVPPLELIQHLAWRGGITETRIMIGGFQEPKQEVFVVEVLVKGLSVSQRLSIGGIEFNPLQEADGAPSHGPFTPQWQAIVSKWGTPSARARAYVTAARIEVAQTEGMKRINAMLDALLAATVYGFSRDPMDRDLPYRRRHALSRPESIPVIYVQGVVTRRAVLESIQGAELEGDSDASITVAAWQDLLDATPPPHVRRALSALRDASDEKRDVVERCHSISSALEHFASTTLAPKSLNDEDLRQVKYAYRKLKVSKSAKLRLELLLGTANQAPLFARVRLQADGDGTPVTGDEWSLLTRLRKVRNDGVHGSTQTQTQSLPNEDEMRQGISLLSRLILHNWTRLVTRGLT